MASFSDIGVSQAAASTITMKLATITQTRNSTITHQEIITLGDPDSTNALMAVVNQAPASTAWAGVVRIAGGPSSLADFSVRAVPPSTAADNPCVATIGTNLQSTAAPAGNSSAMVVRIASGPSSLADLAVRSVWPSTATDNPVQVAHIAISTSVQKPDAYLPIRLSDGSSFIPVGLDYNDGSTTSTLVAPGVAYDNSSNDTMRVVGINQPLPVQLRSGINSYNSTTSTVVSTAASAVYQLVSSVALTRMCVYAFSLTSTASAGLIVEFISSAAGNKWGLDLGSQSSGVTGANLAVSPPARLFASNSGEALNLRLGSTAVQVRYSISWFTE